MSISRHYEAAFGGLRKTSGTKLAWDSQDYVMGPDGKVYSEYLSDKSGRIDNYGDIPNHQYQEPDLGLYASYRRATAEEEQSARQYTAENPQTPKMTPVGVRAAAGGAFGGLLAGGIVGATGASNRITAAAAGVGALGFGIPQVLNHKKLRKEHEERYPQGFKRPGYFDEYYGSKAAG